MYIYILYMYLATFILLKFPLALLLYMHDIVSLDSNLVNSLSYFFMSNLKKSEYLILYWLSS